MATLEDLKKLSEVLYESPVEDEVEDGDKASTVLLCKCGCNLPAKTKAGFATQRCCNVHNGRKSKENKERKAAERDVIIGTLKCRDCGVTRKEDPTVELRPFKPGDKHSWVMCEKCSLTHSQAVPVGSRIGSGINASEKRLYNGTDTLEPNPLGRSYAETDMAIRDLIGTDLYTPVVCHECGLTQEQEPTVIRRALPPLYLCNACWTKVSGNPGFKNENQTAITQFFLVLNRKIEEERFAYEERLRTAANHVAIEDEVKILQEAARIMGWEEMVK